MDQDQTGRFWSMPSGAEGWSFWLHQAPPLSQRPVWVDSLVHGVRLHVSKPDLEVGAEVFSMDLQHGHVSSSVHLQETQPHKRLRTGGTVQVQNLQPHLQPPDHRKGRDWCGDAGQTLVEGELHCLHPDDGPARAVVQHHPAGVSGAAAGLEDTEGLTEEGGTRTEGTGVSLTW